MIDNIILGLETACQPINLLYCFIGVFLGTLVGVLPGIGALAAISLLFPISFYLEPTTALIMLAGIWYGSSYGGKTTSILLNLPGETSSAVICLDGYPMARQGRAGVALFMCTVASFAGGSIGILLLMLFSPVIAQYALSLGPSEYFATVLLGLVAASVISSGNMAKGLAMVVVGIMLSTVGADGFSGAQRFTFGIPNLYEGISLVALAVGVFGIAEVIASVGDEQPVKVDGANVGFRSMIPTRDDVRRSWPAVLRGSAIGSFFGALPGTGPSIATFIAYALEKRASKRPEQFGKGAIEGIMAPEAASNSADQTAFIPTLALGIPGSATMGLMLGALMIHGITPGPRLMTDQPQLFWGLVMSFWIGNIMLVILNLPMIGLWIRILMIPYKFVYPAVIFFVCIGAYSINNDPFDIWVVAAFGLFGYLLTVFSLPAAPALLGFVLGPIMEEQFRRSLLLSKGDLTTFFTRPISATIMAITIALLLWQVYSGWTVGKQLKKTIGRVPDEDEV